jgi:hypothetical protein
MEDDSSLEAPPQDTPHAEEKLRVQDIGLFADSLPKRPEVIVFVSFDLSGSTEFKNKDSNWALKLSNYFPELKRRITEQESGSMWEQLPAHAWKFEGDELLFWIAIKTLDEIALAVSLTYSTLVKESASVKELSDSSNVQNVQLDMKAAMWIALVDGNNNVKYTDAVEVWNEFMGIQIDEGFRVAKTFARSGRLVLSYDIARVLIDNEKEPDDTEELSKRIVCVGFEKLKGVWDGRGYPALWYSTENWKDIQDNLVYDLHLDCKLTQALKEKIEYADKKFFARINKEKPFKSNHYEQIIAILMGQ